MKDSVTNGFFRHEKYICILIVFNVEKIEKKKMLIQPKMIKFHFLILIILDGQPWNESHRTQKASGVISEHIIPWNRSFAIRFFLCICRITKIPINLYIMSDETRFDHACHSGGTISTVDFRLCPIFVRKIWIEWINICIENLWNFRWGQFAHGSWYISCFSIFVIFNWCSFWLLRAHIKTME